MINLAHFFGLGDGSGAGENVIAVPELLDFATSLESWATVARPRPGFAGAPLAGACWVLDFEDGLDLSDLDAIV